MSDFDDRLVGIEADDPDDDDVRESELSVESLDVLDDDEPTVVELAFGQRSWRFGHVIVDEAQDLNPMQWRMVLRRAQGQAMTIVGDLAQRTTGEVTAWADHLPVELSGIDRQDLTVNYRSPAEINELAARVLAQLAPDLPPSTAIRYAGEAPQFVPIGPEADLATLIRRERTEAVSGERLAVIGWDLNLGDLGDTDVEVLTPSGAKGLEFDVVIVVEPAEILNRRRGLAQLYIALTRATRRLVVAHAGELPSVLAG